MNLTIEKGIPLPEIPIAGRPRMYDWTVLEPGDSVVVPRNATAKTAVDWARKHDRKFVSRKTKGGWRVWRVS
jgi:hypothetical protein